MAARRSTQTLGVMMATHETRWLLATALATLSWCAVAIEHIPPVLSDITSVRAVTKQCGKRDKKYWQTSDQEQIRVLVKELEPIRANSTGIYAAKIGCSTHMSFYRGSELLTSIHLFPCNALELAPVSGSRYFNFEHGLNRLPRLSSMLELPASIHPCK